MENFVYNGKYISVSEEVIESNVWERCYLKDGVIVFAQKSNKKWIMILEKRPHEDQPTRMRFVSGHLEAGLSPEENANKELQEEVGLKAQSLRVFYSIKTSGTVNNTVHFVYAQDLIPSKIYNPDGDVVISIHEYETEEILNMFYTDQLKWSLATLGFFRLYHLELNSINS